MYTKNCFPIIVVGLLLLSCEKDNDTRKDAINVGYYNDMVINYYDTTLIGGYHSPQNFNLDLDNNGSEDLQFESEIWGSPGLGQNPKSTIKCLNGNIKLNGDFTSDTLFLHRDTVIYEEVNNTYVKYLRFFYTCHRMNDTDSIYRITTKFKVKSLDRDDILRKADMYNSDTVTLIDDAYSYPPQGITSIGDTNIYEYRIFNNDCNTFPLDRIKYIGLLLDNERLGWIKISIFDKYKIMIHESGVQR